MAKDDIRTLAEKVEPKVLEAIAEIRDSQPRGLGGETFLAKQVEASLQELVKEKETPRWEKGKLSTLAQNEGEMIAKIALDRTNMDKDGHSKLDAQLETITAGVISKDRLHELEKRFAHYEDFDKNSQPFNDISKAIQQGVQKGITEAHPGNIPNAKEQVPKQR